MRNALNLSHLLKTGSLLPLQTHRKLAASERGSNSPVKLLFSTGSFPAGFSKHHCKINLFFSFFLSFFKFFYFFGWVWNLICQGQQIKGESRQNFLTEAVTHVESTNQPPQPCRIRTFHRVCAEVCGWPLAMPVHGRHRRAALTAYSPNARTGNAF